MNQSAGPFAARVAVHVIEGQPLEAQLEIRLIYDEALATPPFLVLASHTSNIEMVVEAVRQNVPEQAKPLLECNNTYPTLYLQEFVLPNKVWERCYLHQKINFKNWFNRNMVVLEGPETIRIEVHVSLELRSVKVDGSGNDRMPIRNVNRRYQLLEDPVEQEMEVDEWGNMYHVGDEVVDEDIEMVDNDDDDEDDDNNEAESTSEWLRG
ncbi:hypothetical protein EDD37DRAFT_606798 [Exophiala viscosa]|uniref:uncharacterized protein n=1 Tax=Exophiala viscosa TaxID=2486360 RepID=UPI00219C05DC|nr:hypothetical protein EDD37DRAFT_606798 [Exophiala viscosa]